MPGIPSADPPALLTGVQEIISGRLIVWPIVAKGNVRTRVNAKLRHPPG